MASEHYGNYQMEIYLDGLHRKLPRFPVDHESLEAAAVEVLPSWIYSYLGYGAGDGRTQQANVDAFGRYAIVPPRRAVRL
jgi:lactate 2-monooxygenase